MRSDHFRKLRQLLREEQQKRDVRYKESGDTYIKGPMKLDEDSGQFYTTIEELHLFGIAGHEVSALTNAHWAYEDIIGITAPPTHPGELYMLLSVYRRDIEDFQFCRYVAEDFIRFAVMFYGVSRQSARGYVGKRIENRRHPPQFY